MIKDILSQMVQNELNNKRVLVLGDVMVDEYIIGKVTRISPEAPIPVLNYRNNELTAGGAGNVAINLKELGCKVELCSVVGDDQYGKWLKEYFSDNGVGTSAVFAEKGRPTTLKQRYATKNQQLLRVDAETTDDISYKTKQMVIDYLERNISKLNAIVISDYTKGMVVDGEFVQKIIQLAVKHDVIVGIDSKSTNISAFKDATFVKPNNLELEHAVAIKIEDDESLNNAGMTYLNKCGANALIVTRGAAGISIFRPNMKRKDFASKAVQVYDVTGAGDTVISTISLALACGINMEDALILANYAASVVISKIGTAAISITELMECGNDK